ALRAACRAVGNYRLPGATLYVTLEPCAMCAGAIVQARIARLVYGAPDPKGGAVAHGPQLFKQPTVHHRPEVLSGVHADTAAEQLRAFFQARRHAKLS
ncbi:MAG: nucleoside deaminase, partial [Pseudomonadota bacterium]